MIYVYIGNIVFGSILIGLSAAGYGTTVSAVIGLLGLVMGVVGLMGRRAE